MFSDLIHKDVDERFLLIPPFYTAGGDEIRLRRNVFVNQNCTFYDLGGLDIADDVMIRPNVSIITTGHLLEPSQRRAITIGPTVPANVPQKMPAASPAASAKAMSSQRCRSSGPILFGARIVSGV